MMFDGFIGIDAKIERAKHHLLDLQNAVKRFQDSSPYEIEAYDEDATGDQVYIVHVLREPPIALATILGDVVNNLRSALDYLVWELASGRGSDTLYFPIRHTAGDFERAIRGLEQIIRSNVAIDLLRATQAYEGGSGHGLWQLHQLNRREKHRFLIPVGAANARATTSMPSAMMEMMRRFRHPLFHPGIVYVKPAERVFPLVEGIELYRLLAKGRGGVVGKNPQFAFEIAFGEGEIFKGEPILPTLAQLTNLVERSINPFRPLLS